MLCRAWAGDGGQIVYAGILVFSWDEAEVVLGHWTVFPSAVRCQMCVCLLARLVQCFSLDLSRIILPLMLMP